MFSEAYKIANQYTNPVIISSKSLDNKVECGGGAFVLLNDEGWILTVAHIFNTHQKLMDDSAKLYAYNQAKTDIDNDSRLSLRQKRDKISRLKRDLNWLTNESYWWGKDGVSLDDIKINPQNDLVIGRLNPYIPRPEQIYPKIKNPSNLLPGMSLCKFGYPFHQITATFIDERNTFQLSPESLPVPVFPIEGILTRFVNRQNPDGTIGHFIETSSPGLRGQSGGPIFDKNAVICGIQSHTSHLPLGFSPKLKVNGREVEEHQFINVGVGVHPEVIIGMLSDNGIRYESE